MNGAGKIPINTLVMAPLGDVLYRGIVVAPRADQSLAEGIVCVAFIPPVTTAEPLASGRSPMQPSLRYGHHPALARPSGRSLAGMAGRIAQSRPKPSSGGIPELVHQSHAGSALRPTCPQWRCRQF
jgi:hypothetical protein